MQGHAHAPSLCECNATTPETAPSEAPRNKHPIPATLKPSQPASPPPTSIQSLSRRACRVASCLCINHQQRGLAHMCTHRAGLYASRTRQQQRQGTHGPHSGTGWQLAQWPAQNGRRTSVGVPARRQPVTQGKCGAGVWQTPLKSAAFSSRQQVFKKLSAARARKGTHKTDIQTDPPGVVGAHRQTR